MIETHLAAERLFAAIAAVGTCAGTDRNDIDTYAVMRFGFHDGDGILVESCDRVSAAQAWVSTSSDMSPRPDRAADTTISVTDADRRLAGLVKYAAKGDDIVTLRLETEAMNGVLAGERQVLEFVLEGRETIRARTLGTAMPDLDAVFSDFNAGDPGATYLAPSATKRLANIAGAVGPITVQHSPDGTALVEPATSGPIDFRAILSMRRPGV